MTPAMWNERPAAGRLWLRDLERWMDDLWEGFALGSQSLAGSELLPPLAAHRACSRTCVPRLDARELADEYRVTAELPGVDARDLAVRVDGGVLCIECIEARHRDPEIDSAPAADSRDDSCGDSCGDSFGERESAPQHRFEHRLRFPGPIAEREVRASFRNGMLKVRVPKQAAADREVLTIPVQTR